LVLRRIHPSLAKPRQKVLRRLEPFGAIPAWSRRPLMKRRLVTPWRIRGTAPPSPYKRQLLEKQRLRFHYNIKEETLQKYMIKAFRKGIEWPADNLLQQLESRADNFVWRVGLAPTMAGARRFVSQGHIQIMQSNWDQWRTISVPSLRLKVGDRVRVSDYPSSQKWGRANHDDEGPVTVPAHIEWDRETMSGTYLDICDRQDFGIDIDERLITLFYSGQRGLRRKHIRYFEGSEAVINKRHLGGKVRPTPENIMNMKQGVGLNKRGRRRPPCLWGRRMPLNSPYHR